MDIADDMQSQNVTSAIDSLLEGNLTDLEGELSRALQSVQAQVGRALIVLLFIFGTAGNALLFCACVQVKLRQQSYSYFLRTLVIVDSANLFVILVEEFTKVSPQPHAAFTDDAGCKAWEYFRQVCGMMSWWLTASLSCERFMILYHPLRGRVFCRGQQVLVVIALILVGSLGLQLHAILQTTYSEGFGCHPAYSDDAFGDLDVFVYKAFGYLVPTIIIVVCNCFVLRKVDSVCVRVKYDDARPAEVQCRFQRKRSEVTVMLLIITFASVFAAIPSHLANFITYLGGESVISIDFVLLYGLKPLLKATLMVTYSCNFYAYILFSTFRKQLKALLKSKLLTVRLDRARCADFFSSKRRRSSRNINMCTAQMQVECNVADPQYQQRIDWHRQFVNQQYHALLITAPNRPLLALST